MPQGALAAYSQQAFGLGWPMIAGVLMAGVVAAAAGFLVSIPVLRLRTDFLAIATLGIAEVIRFIFQNERWLANGPQPMRGIPRPFDCVFADPACSWLPGSIVRFVAPLGPRDYVFLYLVVVQSSSQWSFCCSSASRLPWALQRAVRDSNSAAMDGRTCRWPDRVLRAGHFIMGIAGAFTPITWSHRLQPSTALCHLHRLGDGDAGEPRQQQGAILALRGWGVWSGGLHDRLRRARVLRRSLRPSFARGPICAGCWWPDAWAIVLSPARDLSRNARSLDFISDAVRLERKTAPGVPEAPVFVRAA